MQIRPTNINGYKLMHHGAIALAHVEQNGMNVDVAYCKKTARILKRKVNRLHKQLLKTEFAHKWKKHHHGEFKPKSDPQLRDIVYKVYKKKAVVFTDSGLPSTNQEAMSAVDIPEVDMILELRKLDKIKDYMLSFIREQVNGVIHPFFNLHLVQTYRSSSDSPNFQNLPSRDKEAMHLVRGAIVPPPGMMIGGIDYSGIEVRVGCCEHKDPQMLKYINDPTTDMHRDMAVQLYMLDQFVKESGDNTLRKGTKNGFVFPEFYGSYWEQCYLTLLKWSKGVTLSTGVPIQTHLHQKGIGTPEEFAQHIKRVEQDFWENRFGVYTEWKERRLKEYQKAGYFDLMTEFRCSGVMRRNQVFNYPIQGPGFHCLLWSLINVNYILRSEGFKSRIIGQIHDELVVVFDPKELTEVLDIVRHVMTKNLPSAWRWIVVPLDIEVTVAPTDLSWNHKGEVKKYNGISCKGCGNEYLYWEENKSGIIWEYVCPCCGHTHDIDVPL